MTGDGNNPKDEAVEFFKAEDFFNPPYRDDEMNAKAFADRANRILLERGVRVYGRYKDEWWTEDAHTDADTRTGLLVAIEPLAPKVCEHEPVVWVATSANDPKPWTRYECRKCGAKLRAKWEAAE